jgi:predicted transcriptional regulator
MIHTELKAQRIALGLTKYSVSKISGLTRSLVSNVENGTDCRLSTLNAYANAVGCKIEVVKKTPPE